MQVFVVIMMILIALGLCALIGYQVYALVKAIRVRKQQKSENDNSDRKEIN